MVYVAPERFEAPNWTPDGTTLIFNRNGRIERIPVEGGKPEIIDTGFATRCNNDHGISPDAKWLAISDQSQEEDRSNVYIVPIGGGPPGVLRRSPHRTGMGGHPMARLWRSSGNAAANLIFTQFRQPAVKRLASPPPRVSMTGRNILPTAAISTSTPSAPDACRSGG